MNRKVQIVVDPNAEEEIVIRCKEMTPEILRLQKLAQTGVLPRQEEEMSLRLGDNEYFVPLKDILFFETADNRIAAHTATHMYYSDKTLCELSALLPHEFMRVSKSCIINIRGVVSLHREVTGVCEVFFTNSDKRVYISRMYYKPFREKLLELRLNK